MKKIYSPDQDEYIVRSGTRVRESVRSLPKGHFQQYRQMFEQSPSQQQRSSLSTPKKLSTIHERGHVKDTIPPSFLLKLPVTDDEKLQHSTTSCSSSRSSSSCCNGTIDQHLSTRSPFYSIDQTNNYPIKQTISMPVQTESPMMGSTTSRAHLSSTKSLPTSNNSLLIEQRRLAMEAAVNYTHSYENTPSNHLKRTGSSRQYASSIQRPTEKTVSIPTMTMNNSTILTSSSTTIGRPSSIMSNEIEHSPNRNLSRRVHSSTSLSSTGYDSNSSPSIKSNRNSIATNNSTDFIVHSLSSLSSSTTSSSSDELRRKSKPSTYRESNPIYFTSRYVNDPILDDDPTPAIVVSRKQIQLHQPTIDPRHQPNIRHAIVRNTPLILSSYDPIIPKKPSANFILQTTTFSDEHDSKTDKIAHRWNSPSHFEQLNHNEPSHSSFQRSVLLSPMASTGFQVLTMMTDDESISEHHQHSDSSSRIEHIREDSPLPIVTNPLYHPMPPKKPPRTFLQETAYNSRQSTLIDQTVPSTTTSTHSPSTDLGARSISCMDLTAGVSTTMLNSTLLPLETPSQQRSRPSNQSNMKRNKNVYETLKKDQMESNVFTNTEKETKSAQTPMMKPKIVQTNKTNMKKGVSEPNLPKASRSKSPAATFFSPRHLLDRFKRVLSSSKQSLNEKTIPPPTPLASQTTDPSISAATNDSDDTASTGSENTDQIRTSRLDHVSRVKTMYDTLSSSNHLCSLISDPNHFQSPRELNSLYDYVVHILAEPELGFISHGNGCLSSSNIDQTPMNSTRSTRFKFPVDAQNESTLRYFCFPDQHDSNNNPLTIPKRNSQEYFRFTLTNLHGVRQYGYCSRFMHKGILNALCLVSPYDMIEFYQRILSTATELFISYKEEAARQFLKEIYPHRTPTRGDTIHIDTSTVGLYTLRCDQDPRKELIDSIALLGLSTDTIIKIFSSILYEQKLIFISDEVGRLTRLINTFTCLLYPFSWPHTYVPILPAIMLDVIQAPTPYIIGILRSCESYLVNNDELMSQENSDILIVDIDHDRVRSISEYVSGDSLRGSFENLTNLSSSSSSNTRFQILPKLFKIELKQEISTLKKTRSSLSLDECQQRLRHVFMSIFVESCYNYRDYLRGRFDREEFIQSKQHTIVLFLEWFTQTQIFQIFIRQKLDPELSEKFAITFDVECEKYGKTLQKSTPARVTAKSVKRKSATRAAKTDRRF